ncbi:hypothetical protein BXZ70DRAFT_1012940 [Cristinia sonorae]|uniref:Uncharacterized protein n=1 Tax=Cristinia sonorae TaxID=1940300 RepID=A0A8K0UE12_9AGAR|nr:hypothetical protein BXZ70DRAFT_1012940 [Cristinia sonorae]
MTDVQLQFGQRGPNVDMDDIIQSRSSPPLAYLPVSPTDYNSGSLGTHNPRASFRTYQQDTLRCSSHDTHSQLSGAAVHGVPRPTSHSPPSYSSRQSSPVPEAPRHEVTAGTNEGQTRLAVRSSGAVIATPNTSRVTPPPTLTTTTSSAANVSPILHPNRSQTSQPLLHTATSTNPSAHVTAQYSAASAATPVVKAPAGPSTALSERSLLQLNSSFDAMAREASSGVQRTESRKHRNDNRRGSTGGVGIKQSAVKKTGLENVVQHARALKSPYSSFKLTISTSYETEDGITKTRIRRKRVRSDTTAASGLQGTGQHMEFIQSQVKRARRQGEEGPFVTEVHHSSSVKQLPPSADGNDIQTILELIRAFNGQCNSSSCRSERAPQSKRPSASTASSLKTIKLASFQADNRSVQTRIGGNEEQKPLFVPPGGAGLSGQANDPEVNALARRFKASVSTN